MNNQQSMKADKSQKEAVLRAQQSTEEIQQDQEKLLHPTAASDKNTTEDPAAALNESHQNKMEAWQNLRKMDAALAEKRKEKE